MAGTLDSKYYWEGFDPVDQRFSDDVATDADTRMEVGEGDQLASVITELMLAAKGGDAAAARRLAELHAQGIGATIPGISVPPVWHMTRTNLHDVAYDPKLGVARYDPKKAVAAAAQNGYGSIGGGHAGLGMYTESNPVAAAVTHQSGIRGGLRRDDLAESYPVWAHPVTLSKDQGMPGSFLNLNKDMPSLAFEDPTTFKRILELMGDKSDYQEYLDELDKTYPLTPLMRGITAPGTENALWRRAIQGEMYDRTGKFNPQVLDMLRHYKIKRDSDYSGLGATSDQATIRSRSDWADAVRGMGFDGGKNDRLDWPLHGRYGKSTEYIVYNPSAADVQEPFPLFRLQGVEDMRRMHETHTSGGDPFAEFKKLKFKKPEPPQADPD